MTERFFNNAGPTDCADHYCLDPLRRINSEEIKDLIAQKRYFILHAPRQTGKTTSLLARRVIAPLLAGEDDPEHLPHDDVQYVQQFF